MVSNRLFMNNTVRYLSLFLISVSLLLDSCGEGKNAGNTTDGEQVLDYPVIVLSPRTATLQNIYPARIEGQQNIEIRPKIDGYIEEIYVDEGSIVKKGDRLFKISAPQYEQEVRSAEAAIKIAEANVNTAQTAVNKVRPLVEKNIISKYELEEAEFRLQSEKAMLAQAQATLANAQTNLGYTLIRSPVDGVVGMLPHKIGSLIATNTAMPMTTVSDITNVYAYFSINEKQLLELSASSEGASHSILTDMPPVQLRLSNNTSHSEEGMIDATSGSINSATGSLRVRATFANPQGRIRNGSSGSVVIPLKIDEAILVPQKSTYEIQGSKFVYLINNENKAISTAITVMDNSDGRFYVVTEGLKAGDKIALEGLPSLRDGVTIKQRPVDADSVYNEIANPHKSIK